MIKRLAYLPLFLLLCAPGFASAQEAQVIELRVTNEIPEIEDRPRTVIYFYLPVDLTDFEINNPMDMEASEITTFSDNTGKDLLQVHLDKVKAEEERGIRRSSNEVLRFNGTFNTQDRPGVQIEASVQTDPGEGAEQLEVAGKITLNFISQDDEQTVTVNGVPMEMGYNDPGYETKIGFVKIDQGGSATINDIRYNKYRVSCESVPILQVGVVGGDDRKALEGMFGASSNEIVFQEENIPETVELEITYGALRKEEIPFELNLGVGL